MVGLLPLGWAAFATGGGGPSYRYAFRFIDWPGRVLTDLHLDSWVGLWNSLLQGKGITAVSVGVFFAAWGLTLLGAFGPSFIALPRLARDFIAGPKDAPRFFLSGLAAACFLYFFFFEVRLGPLDRTILNIYVFYFGLVLVLIYAADVFLRFAVRRSGIIGAVLLAIAVVLTLPNAIIFLQQKLKTPEKREFSALFLEASRWLTLNTPAEAVILQPIDIRHLCYFAGRRVVLDDSVNSYLDFHLPGEEISRRRDGINRFFGGPEGRADILARYGVSFVLRSNDRLFPENQAGNIIFDSALSSDHMSGVPRPTALKRVFRNEGFTIYRVEK